MSSPLPICRDVTALRDQVSIWKNQGLSVGLVPTMGALHQGHLSLIENIKGQVDRVITTIFVNPTQFAAHEDLNTYPRQEQEDCAKIGDIGADLAYIPTAETMYPESFDSSLRIGGASHGLESDARPHFFSGVAIVVLKLFMQSQADKAIFGEKDYQQLLVIKKMVKDLDIPIDILSGEIIREADGLAMSSRNAYLDLEQRKIAASLNAVLRQLALSELPREQAETQAEQALLDAGFTSVDYATIRDADTLAVPSPATQRRRALIVARLGEIRLLDNMAAR